MAKRLEELAFIDSAGFHIADFEDFLEFNRDALQRIYGADINLDPDSQDGQLVTHISQSQYDLAVLCAAVFNAYSPLTAVGESLSRQVKLNGIKRHEATNSLVDLKIIGKAGTEIKKGKVRDVNDRLWLLPEVVTIPLSGSVIVTATSEETGAFHATPGTVSRIATPTDGWYSVTNEADSTPGVNAESDVALRRRQTHSTAMPSQAVVKGILGDIFSALGVTRAKLYENDTDVKDSNGLPAHSISAVVEGGDAQTIAEIIRKRKTAGCGTFGTTKIALSDPNGMPISINFFRPTLTNIYVKVTVKPLVGFSSTYADEIKSEIVNYVNDLGIGSTLYLSKLFVPANLEKSDHDNAFDVESIEIGTSQGVLSCANIKTAFNAVPFCKPDFVEVRVNG